MAVEIVRSLEEIDRKVKDLNKTLRSSAAETRELDKALRLDSKNADAVTKKMSALQTSVGTATKKVDFLNRNKKSKQVNRKLYNSISYLNWFITFILGKVTKPAKDIKST